MVDVCLGQLVVQAIMAGLAFASFVTWTIFVAKFIELFIAKRRLACGRGCDRGRAHPERGVAQTLFRSERYAAFGCDCD